MSQAGRPVRLSARGGNAIGRGLPRVGEHKHFDSDRPAPLSRAEQYGLSFAIIRNLAWLSRLRIQKILVEL